MTEFMCLMVLEFVSASSLWTLYDFIGISKRELFPDAKFKASSELEDASYTYSADQGRLVGPLAWCPKTTKPGEWLQIDVGTNRSVEAIVTWGLHGRETTSYNVSTSDDGRNWTSFGQVSRDHVSNLTRLALASVLGPFGVHCSALQYISVHLCMVMQFIS